MKTSPEVLGGLVLLLAAIAALLFVNLGGAGLYHHLLEWPLTLGLSPFSLTKSLHHWVNDGLMVLFFLLVGIEIHKELRTGTLRNPKQALVPLLAALGGFALPALVYLGVAHGAPDLTRGWSIPTATDIAFAVALVTVLKKHVPPSLRIFLLALAVADDLFAILVIAFFYTTHIFWMNLFLAAAAVAFLVVKNQLGLRRMEVYIVFGLILWLCVLQSGVHATIAGVIMGLLLPLKGKKGRPSPADTIEHALQPWVRWAILPLFAFTNVGVSFAGLSWQHVFTPLTIGITLGLFLGKQLGVFGTVWLLEKVFKLPRPTGSTWRQVYGVACVCGIGFTMSLFVGTLALAPEHQTEVRLGVIAGSLLSTLMAVLILTLPTRKKPV